MKTQTFVSRISSSLVCIPMLMLSCLLLSCDDDELTGPNVKNTNFSASQDFSFRIDVANRSRLRLIGVNGTVEITGASNIDSVAISGERRVESESTADAQAHLVDLSVDITQDVDEITVQTKQPDQTFGRNYVVDYQIQVPASWRLDVVNLNGEMTISSMEDSVSAALVNGSMHLWDISASVNGDVINGEIDARVFLPDPGSCILNLINGQIGLAIPQSTSANFSARVSNGTIMLSNLTLQGQVTTPTSLTGILGAGSGRIDLETVNGNITVTGI